jgi:hypothetical protein
MAKFDFKMEHVFSYNATLATELIGPVPDDFRVNFYVTGGDVWTPDGTKIGKVRGVGGDWLTIRRDNKGVLDVRATVEMNDGALLYATYNGYLDLGANGYNNLLKGIWPEKSNVRAAPRIVTASPAHGWVNGTQFVNIGEVFFNKGIVTYDVYALS